MAAHSSDHAVTSDSRTGLFSASAPGRTRGATNRATWICAQATNYNDRVLALRYVYVLALSIWFGGIIMIGAIVSPVSDGGPAPVLLTSYICRRRWC